MTPAHEFVRPLCPTCCGEGIAPCLCTVCRTDPAGCRNPVQPKCVRCGGTGEAPCEICGSDEDVQRFEMMAMCAECRAEQDEVLAEVIAEATAFGRALA